MPGYGDKVRVCEGCVTLNIKHHAAAYVEDLEAMQETVEILRSNLKARDQETDVFKRVLLELQAQALEDSSQRHQYAKGDPQNGSSFPKIQQQVQDLWKELQASGGEHANQMKQIEKERDADKKKSEEMKVETVKLELRRQELDSELREVDMNKAECDEQERRKINLDEGVKKVRDSIARLEKETQAHQEREAERLRRNISGVSSPPNAPMSLTISSGTDPLATNRNRLAEAMRKVRNVTRRGRREEEGEAERSSLNAPIATSQNRLEGCRENCSLM